MHVFLLIALILPFATLETTDAPSPPTSCPAIDLDGERPQFAIRFGDEISPYRLVSQMVEPGATVDVGVLLADRSETFRACFHGRELVPADDGNWTVEFPDSPGPYDLVVVAEDSGQQASVRFFVAVPYAGEDRIGSFRIGKYQTKPLRGLDSYRMPTGFIRINGPDDLVAVSDSFSLQQFLSKQAGDYPKYVRINARALLKMERLLEEVRSRGIPASTFTVMSAFRTPWYNESIGNTTKYSRHLYGDAVDIYIDEDHDGRMDDINGDGVSNYADAKRLAAIFEEVADEAWYQPFVGGLGIYGPRSHRGAFVHIDTRGYRARWTSP